MRSILSYPFKFAQCLFCCGVLLGAAPGIHAATTTELRVMSFNIWVQGGRSLSNCIEAIRLANADIVGLQECNAVTAQTIATRLGFHVFAASGPSLVSRFPIVATHSAGSSRGITVEIGRGQRVHLFNCHLTPYPYGPYELKNGKKLSEILALENQTRMPALTLLLDYMRPYLAGTDPVFLTGDFNAPSHLDYVNFPWPTSVACIDAGLKDAYAELHPQNRKYPPRFAFDDPGITWTPATDQEPEGVFDRIDFLYYSPEDGVSPARSTELDGRNSVAPWPSDHRAVLGVFTLQAPELGATPASPIPANGAQNVPLTTLLAWTPASNMISQAIYWGTNSPGALRTNTSASSLSVSNLLPGTTYYWRVDTTVTSGVVTGEVWSFTTASAPTTRVYEWNFALGDLQPALGGGNLELSDAATGASTVFGTTDGMAVPHIEGRPGPYLFVPQMSTTQGGYDVTLTDSVPNDGGSYINQYTIIQDLLVPAPLNWTALFNTNTQNANDADFYINPSGALGIGALGFSANGVITPNTWQRVAFVADLGAGTVSYYVNGTRVHQRTGASLLDGRHSLYSGVDAGPDLLLFNEGDASGNYTHALYLSAWAFTDRVLTDAEVAALGGPRQGGIFPGGPIRVLGIRDGSNLSLRWTGGKGPFQVLRIPSLLAPMWQSAGPRSYERTFTEVLGSDAGFFFRVVEG